MMPASGGDPVSTALRLSLNSSQNSTENKNLDKSLIASATRVLLTNIEYEPVGNCLSTVLNHLKSKYIPLKSQDVNKNGVDVPHSSHASVSSSTNGSSMKPELDSLLPSPKIVLFPPENVQLGWRGSHCVGAGMINVGNTCYLNSTLQALFHIPAFVNWLHSDTLHLSSCSVANGTVNGECIICAMNKTLKASENKTGGVIKPFLICNKLKFICKHLVHGQQEDAHEFMRYLLESMEKAYLLRCKGTKLDVYSKETTPLNQIFGGYIRTEVTCLQCNGVSTTFQHCQDLLLDIRRAATLDDALASYFCKERLDGEDAYRCERCHRKVSATKKFSIEKPPQVLCIQLKRFSILGGKINKHVSFTQRLDLTNFLCPQSTCKGPLPLTYHLVSMVTHVGPSVHCGHYTAVAQTSTGQYYHFDDVIVRPISLQSVLDTNAYIMMYEREPYHSPHHSSVSSTSVSSVLNGQKQNSLAIRGTTVAMNSKINTAKHKPSSLVMNNRKTETETNKPNLTNFGPLPLPPAKERDRVVFDLHQPTATPPPSQLVVNIKKGKALEAPPLHQQEPSSSASLVPYCESGEDESNESSDSETADPPGLDMPSLTISDVTHNKSLVLNCKAQSKRTNNIESVGSQGMIPIVNSHPAVNKSESGVPTKSVNGFANGTTVLPSLVNKSSSEMLRVRHDSSLQKRSSLVLVDKHKTSSTGVETCDFRSKKSSSPCSRNANENPPSTKASIQQTSQSKSNYFTPSKSITESAVSKRQDGWPVESSANKTIFLDGSTNKDKQILDLASSKEVVGSSMNGVAGNLVNTTVLTARGKQASGWQVTDLLLHSPSVASESSTTSNSIANSTTDWDVSDVVPPKTSKKQNLQKSLSESVNSNFLSINSYKPSYQNFEQKHSSKIHSSKSSSEKLDRNRAATLPKVELHVNGELSRYNHKALLKKNFSAINEAGVTSNKLSSKQRDKSSADETKFIDKKREKKPRKLKKHKKREKVSTEDGDTGSEEEAHYEWVEKTRETLELESNQRDVNGSCWDGTRKSNVINHLTNLSHRGYGTSNVTTWAGEQSRMDEELQRSRMEDRKRSYETSYDDDLDRGRVKKIKYHHSVQHHKYNRFQEYHNFKHWTNNNNNYGSSDYYKTYSNKGYYHYNNFSARHKVYNGRSNGYHHGGKYRNHYSKRDSWQY